MSTRAAEVSIQAVSPLSIFDWVGGAGAGVGAACAGVAAAGGGGMATQLKSVPGVRGIHVFSGGCESMAAGVIQQAGLA